MKNLTVRFSQNLKVVPLIILSFILVSCGSSSSYVTDVKVSSTVEQGDLIVSVGADLSIGNISISDIAFPIIIPKTGKEVGEVSMYTNLGGGTRFEVDVNASAIANIDALVARLPNGNLLPLVRENNSIAIPIDGGRANVYLAFSDGVAAIGASIGISGLDSVGRSVGTASLFPAFNFGDVRGSAGLYLSNQSGKNGFALMVDISDVIDTNDLLASKPVLFASAKSASVSIASADPLELDYSSINMSRSKKRKLDKKLLRLHRKKATL